ncbi:hypothetical protein [Mesorhizobium helmanticense]|uniref:Uncharacterized protein n=1 Tax=Mesorhizobium helmanticense TaxID=1776423 RepID=A0A2T4IP66_9HYPH|nr:hypothetical protein [Mesorhizobium helmanticense]PTE07400.1 hypothetical protein C9427_27255 [Mesorhizobium helmanticense]
MVIDKTLKRLMKRQSQLTRPGSGDHLICTVERRLVTVTCAVCGNDFQAVQAGRRKPSTRCSEACRLEGRRRYSNVYNAAARQELADLRARAAAGELERFGIGRDGRAMPKAETDFDD